MGLTFLFAFVLVEELDSSAYPEDLLDVEVKYEPMEHNAVSCGLFFVYLIWFFIPLISTDTESDNSTHLYLLQTYVLYDNKYSIL